ncbi:MAG: fused MFS/spermidine synthase [Sedimentisphaerales bacterium]|nr:fused MFS/spermidine synthase [Sedimentisphaerales bacterium]
MSRVKSFAALLIPSLTVFFSSACIMIVELVAGRLIAKHLGSSLYTWTSIIGVVLAGITIGNYIGGRLADRFAPRKTLSSLFGLASVACVTIVILNNIVGDWVWLWHLHWPVRVFMHVTLVFLVPSTLLGTISPVVAKMALDRGLATGRTIGDIYAWGAAGSIAGTFLAGFYLIAAMGTIAILWTVAGCLLLMAILYYARLWVLYIWAILLIVLIFLGMGSSVWAQETGATLALREAPNPNILYEDETPYCYVSVKRVSENPDRRLFIQDKLKHSEIVMDNLDDLRYFYTHIYAGITQGLRKSEDPISIMVIGGGGYVYPQYIEKHFPNSRIDVVEIDPGVTEAAMQAFGLFRNTKINSITMDARNYVDQLLLRQQSGQTIPRYDFIYEDAINDYSVPYQLVTKEFNDKIYEILTDDGVYMVNLIDIYSIGRFLGSMVTTLEKTFPYVSVVTEDSPRTIRSTFVVIAAKKTIDLQKILGNYLRGADMWYLSQEQLEDLRTKAGHKVMTDDFVPVENMLAPVVRQSTTDTLAIRLKEEAEEAKLLGHLEESIAKYRKLVEIESTMALLAYNEIAIMLVQQNKLEQAAEYFQKAIAYNEHAESKVNIAGIHLNLALILRESRPEESKRQFALAIDSFQKQLVKEPDSIKTTVILANTLREAGRLPESTEYFNKAVNLNPYDVNNHIALAQSREAQGLYDEAIAGLKKAIGFYARYNRTQEIEAMQKYVDLLEFKKARQLQDSGQKAAP